MKFDENQLEYWYCIPMSPRESHAVGVREGSGRLASPVSLNTAMSGLRIPRFVRLSASSCWHPYSCDFSFPFVARARVFSGPRSLPPSETILPHQASHGVLLSCAWLSMFSL